MISLRDVCSCIRRLHPDLRGRINPETFERYRASVELFINYLHGFHDLQLQSPEDLDWLMLEYRTECELTRSQQMLLVAAIEFFIPHVKGRLQLSRESLRGRTQQADIHHTIPLTVECTMLFAAYHASRGLWKLGAAVVVQQSTGLRPSELLGLEPHHIHIPNSILEPITMRLGATRSTKVKREQYVLVDPAKQLLAYRLLKTVHSHTVLGQRLFSFSYSYYNLSFKEAEKHYGLNLGTTPHSPRSGFATTAVLRGELHKEIQSKGRWLSETSFHTYIDIAGAAHIKAQVASQRLEDTAHWISDHFWDYFPVVIHLHEQEENRLGGPYEEGASSSRSSFGRKPCSSSRTPGSLDKTSEAPVARRTMGGSSSRPTLTSSNLRLRSGAKGKGRGHLRQHGVASDSIYS